MILRSIISLGLSAWLVFTPAQAQNKKVSFDGQAAYSYIKVLAADEMQGRKSGEAGGRMAAEYIVSKLKEWGLEPAGPGGSYYQHLTFEYHAVERGASLDIISGKTKREFVYEDDWRVLNYSGSGQFATDIVFVGYGIFAPQKGYDDYSGVDVKGKLVLFSADTLRKFEETLKEEARYMNRVKAAQDHGARGVLTFRAESQTTMAYRDILRSLKKEVYNPDFVIISVEMKVVDFIFKHLKTELRYLFQQVEATSKPQSFDTGVRTFVNITAVYDEKRPTQNVLAKISGTDKNLRNECIILGGHMDHLGVNMTGDVFNGADDNASGTAVVMEVARTMKLSQFKPKRTVVFALWAAEEAGLDGSKYYTENPIYPLEQTVAYINLDMEGHGTGKVNFSGVYYAPEIWDLLKARLPKEISANVIPSRGGPGGSDHTHFLSKGVPGFYVMTQGAHFRTNKVGDVIDMIKPEVVQKAGDFVLAAVEILASEPKVPIIAERRANYYWKYETVINYEIPPLDKAIEAHKDVQDPDVDFQLAVVSAKEGLTGDGLRVEVMNNLLDGLEKIRASKGLSLYQGAPSRLRMMGMGRLPRKTTVLPGLHGIASFRDDLRWADVFSKQGVVFVFLDKPGLFFGDKGLSDEGKKVIEALGKANLLLTVKGADAAQTKILLENTKKPLFLEMSSLPDNDVIGLVKKTNSAIGLVLGKEEEAASYFRKLDEAKKVAGTEYLSIVTENCLWSNAGKEQMIKLIDELLKAKYESDDLANLFSATFMRVLSKVRPEEAVRPAAFMPF